MKKILTVGVFDYFHLGHLRFFEKAKTYGDFLIVAVQDSKFVLKYKPGANLLYDTDQRIDLVKALRVVDEVITYRSVDEIITVVDFDVFVIGEDQNHTGFQNAVKWCNENSKEVIRLKRTPGISSSSIKEILTILK
ncbi:Glycerol-3-phosphate cytidylyltransferase [bioreactor metagenome]|uniref:Glycerol-3-phosphate cytidylyltransferase n=1 Tax=bioreactor metagenome TaxID=1076179 RepID=A0A644TYP3_9ZZZZ